MFLQKFVQKKLDQIDLAKKYPGCFQTQPSTQDIHRLTHYGHGHEHEFKLTSHILEQLQGKEEQLTAEINSKNQQRPKQIQFHEFRMQRIQEQIQDREEQLLQIQGQIQEERDRIGGIAINSIEEQLQNLKQKSYRLKKLEEQEFQLTMKLQRKRNQHQNQIEDHEFTLRKLAQDVAYREEQIIQLQHQIEEERTRIYEKSIRAKTSIYETKVEAELLLPESQRDFTRAFPTVQEYCVNWKPMDQFMNRKSYTSNKENDEDDNDSQRKDDDQHDEDQINKSQTNENQKMKTEIEQEQDISQQPQCPFEAERQTPVQIPCQQGGIRNMAIENSTFQLKRFKSVKQPSQILKEQGQRISQKYKQDDIQYSSKQFGKRV